MAFTPHFGRPGWPDGGDRGFLIPGLPSSIQSGPSTPGGLDDPLIALVLTEPPVMPELFDDRFRDVDGPPERVVVPHPAYAISVVRLAIQADRRLAGLLEDVQLDSYAAFHAAAAEALDAIDFAVPR